MKLSEIVSEQQHGQRVFAVVILIEALLLVMCIAALSVAMFVMTPENTEAMTALVSITTTLIGSFTTLLAARGIINHNKQHQHHEN
jgi:hypothetical protein